MSKDNESFEKARDKEFFKHYPDAVELAKNGVDMEIRNCMFQMGADWSRQYTLKHDPLIQRLKEALQNITICSSRDDASYKANQALADVKEMELDD